MNQSWIPVGFCQCGCGKRTNLARQNDSKKGWTKGQPLPFLRGHNARKPCPISTPVGFCKCGCGQVTALAPQTQRSKGWIKGQPLPYLQGHASRQQPPQLILELYRAQDWKYPIGYCQCGCGEKTPIATKTALRNLQVKGQPLRYLQWHHIDRHDYDKITNEYFDPKTWAHPIGLCQCGCGAKTELASLDRPERGILKGFPLRWIKGHGVSYYGLNPDIPHGYKQCPMCDSPKLLSEFTMAPNGTYFARCKEHSASNSNQEKGVAALADRKYHIKSKYKIDINEYERMFKKQNGLCAICKNPERIIHPKTGMERKLSVDHDANTGRVRGLLCGKCNPAIGLLDHDIERLASAIEYLTETG